MKREKYAQIHMRSEIDLVVAQSEISQEAVVLHNIVLEFLDFRFIFKVQVTLKEPLVELDDLSKREVLAGRLVETTCGLDDLGYNIILPLVLPCFKHSNKHTIKVS